MRQVAAFLWASNIADINKSLLLAGKEPLVLQGVDQLMLVDLI